MFKKATKGSRPFRIALDGPSGSGKTWTALMIAHELTGGNFCVIDTERGSASLYADKFGSGEPKAIDTFEPEDHHPKTYVKAIKAAESAGYKAVVIDSLSHAWTGKDGALELADKAAKKSQSGNSFTAWRDVTPLHNELVDTLVSSKIHVICTMRTKTEYVMEQVQRGGKTVTQPRKVGLEPIQRAGMEYEMDLICDLDLDHNLIVSKTRFDTLDGLVINKPGVEFVDKLRDWLSTTTTIELSGAEQLRQAVKEAQVIQPERETTPVEREASKEPEEASGEQVVEPAAAAPADEDYLIGSEDWARLLVKAQPQGWNNLDLQRLSAKTFKMPLEDAEIITLKQAKRLAAIVSRLTPEKAGVRNE